MGLGSSLVESFLFLFLTQELGSSYLVCGISVVITVSFEIPLFFVSDKLLDTCGVVGLILIAQCSYALRVFGYTFVSNAFLVLAFEPLHGVTYACMKTAMVHFASTTIARRGLETTAQGLTTSTQAFGTIVGQWIGGWVLQEFGSDVLFRGAGVIVVCSAALLLLMDLLEGRP